MLKATSASTPGHVEGPQTEGVGAGVKLDLAMFCRRVSRTCGRVSKSQKFDGVIFLGLICMR